MNITFWRPNLSQNQTYHFLYPVFVIFVQNFTCHRKDDFHILARFRRRLNKEWNLVFLLEFARLLNGHLSMLLPILLVANQNYDQVWRALSHHFRMPVSQIFKCFCTCDIVSQKDAMGPFVKDLGDWFEWLLASSVPNLQFENLCFHFDQQGSKFDPHCHLVVISELVGGNSVHETTFSDSWVANNDYFEKACFFGVHLTWFKQLVRHLVQALHQLCGLLRRAFLL